MRRALDAAWQKAVEHSPAEDRLPGTIREYVKAAGDTHAKQFDDVRFGARDVDRRRLSDRSYDLLRKRLLVPALDVDVLTDLDEAFEVYAASEALRSTAIVAEAARSELAPDIRAIVARAGANQLGEADLDLIIGHITQEQSQDRLNALSPLALAVLSEVTDLEPTPSLALLAGVVSGLVSFDAFMRRDAFHFDYFANVTFEACDVCADLRGIEACLLGWNCLLGRLEDNPEVALDRLEILIANHVWMRRYWTGKVSKSGNVELMLQTCISAITARLMVAVQMKLGEAVAAEIAIEQRAVRIFNLIEYQPPTLPKDGRSELLDLRWTVAWAQVKVRGDIGDRREAIAAMEDAWELFKARRVVGLFDIADYFNGLLACLVRSGLYNSINLAAGLTADAYKAAGSDWLAELYDAMAGRSVTESMESDNDLDEPTLSVIEFGPLLEILRQGQAVISTAIPKTKK